MQKQHFQAYKQQPKVFFFVFLCFLLLQTPANAGAKHSSPTSTPDKVQVDDLTYLHERHPTPSEIKAKMRGGSHSSNAETVPHSLDKVCIIGSGNWGSAIATKVGQNCARLPYFEDRVNMWVFEEMVDIDGERKKLTHVINSQHENVKYLPGTTLPDNIVAVADLEEACKDATLLIFVLPHQFLPKLLPTIRRAAHPSCRGVSLIKGLGTLYSCSDVHTIRVLLDPNISFGDDFRFLQRDRRAEADFEVYCRCYG